MAYRKSSQLESDRFAHVISVIKMLNLINNGKGKTVSELSTITKRHPKTVRRMLIALQEHNFPVWDDQYFNDYTQSFETRWKSRVRIVYDR